MKLRPSVLQVGDSNSNSSVTNQDNNQKIGEKVQADNNVFKFAPLLKPSLGTSNGGQSSNQEVKSISGSSTSTFNSETQDTGFLFGQNLEERVLLPNKDTSTSKDDENSKDENEMSSLNTCNPTTQILPEKRKYEVITGEEDESNVLQIFCKLYLWDSATAFWKEKGKGMLRLNDKMKDDKLCSRLVMRTAGSLKVILNASIVSGMKFELSNEKCLRFTCIDGIYLFKGKEKDIEQLNSAIECRLRELSKKVKVETDGTPTETTINESSDGTTDKTSEDSTEDSKEEIRQLDVEESDLHKETIKDEIQEIRENDLGNKLETDGDVQTQQKTDNNSEETSSGLDQD
ncbi:ran-binding protein 3 [Tetranychus urticae]|uniref:RanBD1 domain-containing protein n=1 Tax=Tetranychus urticae TaxID=32264 RepID=T1K6S2_TETUR|nr:ran-binding protein 3 [Tetranychus urticae]